MRLCVALVALGGCAIGPPSYEAPRAAPEPHAPILGPTLSPWPDGLPDPVTDVDGAVTLPAELADVVHRRLLECEVIPSLAALALQEQASACSDVLAAEHEACAAESDASTVDLEISAAGRWPPMLVGLVVASGVIAGLLLGGLAGYAIAGNGS